MKKDPLGRVKITTLRSVVGEVEGAQRQDGAHDVVTFETELDDVYPPELANGQVGGEGGVRVDGEVVEEFKLQQG